jgi:hypothetical protein
MKATNGPFFQMLLNGVMQSFFLLGRARHIARGGG